MRQEHQDGASPLVWHHVSRLHQRFRESNGTRCPEHPRPPAFQAEWISSAGTFAVANASCQECRLVTPSRCRPPLDIDFGSSHFLFEILVAFARSKSACSGIYFASTSDQWEAEDVRWPNARQPDGVRPSVASPSVRPQFASVQGRWRQERSKVSPEVVLENSRKQVSHCSNDCEWDGREFCRGNSAEVTTPKRPQWPALARTTSSRETPSFRARGTWWTGTR